MEGTMTVTFDWLEEDDGDNQESGGLDAYIDVDGSGISFSGDQISSTNFDGGIPKAQPTNTQIRNVVPGNYVFWNISTNTPMTVSIGADVDGEDDGSETTYDSNLYLVLDIEYDDVNDPDGNSTTATRYLYLQDEDESVRVSATGGTTVTIIGNSSPAEWDAGTNGWILTSDGNAIFSNVLVRGTIVAQSGDISGDLSFGGSLVGTNSDGVGVAIYGSNPQISSSNNTGVLNAIGTSFQTAFDANDIQTFSFASTNTALLRIQRLGGGLQIGDSGTESDTNLYGDLYIRGSGGLTYALEVNGTVQANRFNSVVATGTAPLTVSSTTTVTNLSSERLGGFTSSQYLRSDTSDTWNGNTFLFQATSGGHITFRPLDASTSFRIIADGVEPKLTYPASGLYGMIGDNSKYIYQGWFSQLYKGGASVTTSDERLKNSISDSDLGLGFINSIRPVKFKFNNGNKKELDEEGNVIENMPGTRWHYGFIAQEIKSILDVYGIDTSIWNLIDKYDLDSTQALAYEELIAPSIKAIQELNNKVIELENRLAILEG
jgi:hypothetical protein